MSIGVDMFVCHEKPCKMFISSYNVCEIYIFELFFSMQYARLQFDFNKAMLSTLNTTQWTP